MRRFVSIIITTFFLLSPTTFAKGLQTGIGKIIQPKKELNLPYDYYVTLQKSDGTVLAFPLKAKKIDLKKLKKKELYMMTFTTESEKLTIGEKTQDFSIINLVEAKYLSMKELSTLGISTENIEKNVARKSKGKEGLRINDKLTNAIIYTAGALLLGSIIAD